MLFCRDNDGNVYLSVGLKFETAKENLIVVEERDFWIINYIYISFIYVFKKFSKKLRDLTTRPKKIESSVSLMDSFQLNSTFERNVACSNLQ